MKTEIEATPSKYPKLTIDSGLIYYTDTGKARRLYVPKDAQLDLLHQYHKSPFSCHFGINATTKKLQQKYYWPQMQQDVIYMINNCRQCNLNKGRTARAPIHPYAPGEPLEHLICDVLGPLPKTKQGNKYIVSFMDRF